MPHRRKGSSKIYIRVQGVRQSAGTDIWEDAKALEDKLNHEVWLNEKMGLPKPKSWKEAVVRWCHEHSGKVTMQNDIYRFRWLDERLGHIPDISKISRDFMHELMLTRGISLNEPSSANTTANHYVILVGSVLKSAETQWGWGNVCPRFRTYKTPPSPGRALTVDEWESLERILPIHLKRIAGFAVCTGLRLDKILTLKWEQVNLERRFLSHTGVGNKIANIIPLNDRALSILKEIKQDKIVHNTHVFTKSGVVMKYYSTPNWKRLCEKAGIGTLRFHDLRHTFVSWLAWNGVEREIRMRLVGHKLPSSHEKYTHMSTNDLLPYSKVIDAVLSRSENCKAVRA
jgi:integrase